MKKVTVLMSFLTFLSFTIFAQSQRTTLIEQFTSSTCGPCKPGNVNVNAVLPTLDNYTIIKYQMSWPGTGDPYYTAEAGVRRTYYGVNSVPNLWIDGQWGDNSNDFTKQIYDVFHMMPTNLEIEVDDAIFNPSDSTVSVDITIDPSADINDVYQVYVAIVENETFNNKKSNGEVVFEMVFMKFLSSPNGDMLTTMTNGTKVTQSFTGDMIGTFMEEIDDLRAIVWVQNPANKNMMGSAWLNLRDIATVGVEEIKSVSNVTVYPNPFESVATVQFDLDESTNMAVNVYDITGKMVQSIENKTYSVGTHKLEIDGSNLNGGMYYVNIVSDKGVMTRKLVLNK